MTRFVDLSVTLSHDLPELVPVRIDRTDHRRGTRGLSLGAIACTWFRDRSVWKTLLAIAKALRLMRSHSAWPEGLGLSTESVRLTTHAGTHLDAPWHYGPTSKGERAIGVDEVPLEWCYGPGVVLDLRDAPPRSSIEPEQLERALESAGHVLEEADIVLCWTGASEQYRGRAYLTDYSGLSGASVRWLIDRGVRVIGTDAFGLDRPFQEMLDDWDHTGDGGVLWPAHFEGRTTPYCQLERLTNLGALPSTGFRVACFPVKLEGASASWIRAVAIIEE